MGKWTFHKLPGDSRTKHTVQKPSRRKTKKITCMGVVLLPSIRITACQFLRMAYFNNRRLRGISFLKTKTSKTLLESLLFVRTCSVAQEDGKVNFPQTSWRHRTKHGVRKLSRRKTKKKILLWREREIMVFQRSGVFHFAEMGFHGFGFERQVFPVLVEISLSNTEVSCVALWCKTRAFLYKKSVPTGLVLTVPSFEHLLVLRIPLSGTLSTTGR